MYPNLQFLWKRKQRLWILYVDSWCGMFGSSGNWDGEMEVLCTSAWAEISHSMSKGSHGGWGEGKFMPAFLSHLPVCSPASTDCLTSQSHGKIRPCFPSLGCMGQAKWGLCPRCLTVLNQSSSANKEKERDFTSDRVAWHDQHAVTL